MKSQAEAARIKLKANLSEVDFEDVSRGKQAPLGLCTGTDIIEDIVNTKISYQSLFIPI